MLLLLLAAVVVAVAIAAVVVGVLLLVLHCMHGLRRKFPAVCLRTSILPSLGRVRDAFPVGTRGSCSFH